LEAKQHTPYSGRRHKKRRVGILRLAVWTMGLVSASPLMAGMATAYQDATHLYLENDGLRIAVLRSTGNLDGIIHKQSGVNLQSNAAND
jgi:hypothetical protein